MDEIACKGCGYHFPQKAKKGTVPCPHCGRPTHIPGAVVCPECDHLNQDVSYCVACGAALFKECPECDARMEVDQKACGQCGAVCADYDLDPEKEDSQSLSPSVLRRVGILFFLGAIFWPPLLIPATFIMAVRKRGVYWLLFLFTTGFFLSLVALALAVLDLPFFH